MNIDRFLREKNQPHWIRPNLVPNERHIQNKKKSSVGHGSRVHCLAMVPISIFQELTVLSRVCELLNRLSAEIEILSDLAEIWSGPKSGLNMS